MFRSKPNKLMLSISFAALTSLMSPSVFAQVSSENDEEKEKDEIIATGIRQSIANSIQKKRRADVVIDAITSEDIGQFTDDSIVDSIQRIPGVQVERDEAGTDGDRVSIRGLGPQFVTTTVNGRSLLSSGTAGLGNLRSVNIGAFPSEVVNGVTVAKSSSAARNEAGLGGSVDILTLRPLDSRALRDDISFANVTGRIEQSGVEDDTGYRISGAVGRRNEAGTLGAYIAASGGNTKRRINQVNVNAQDRNFRVRGSDGIVRNESYFAPVALVRAPVDQDIDRLAIAGGIQYKPSDTVELNFDGTYTLIDNKSDRRLHQTLFARAYNGITPEENIIVDENNVLQHIDLSDQNLSPLLRNNHLTFDNRTENLILGGNAKFQSGALNHTFDAYHSAIKYDQDIRQALFQLANWDAVGVVYQSDGFLVPTLQGFGERAIDPTGYASVQAAAREVIFEAQKSGVSYDLDVDVSRGLIKSLQLGVSYSISDLDSSRTLNKFYQEASGNSPADVLASSLTGTNVTGFLSDVEGYAPTEWFITDYNLAASGFENGFLTDSGVDELGLSPLETFGVDEDILSLYAQADFSNPDSKIPFSGNFGLRGVNTKITTTGFAIGDGIADIDPIEFNGEKFELLPSMNIKFDLTDQFVARFSAGRTLTRADQSDIAPRVSVDPENTDQDSEDFGLRTVRAGNPDLVPITAWNFDATFEWYPNDTSSFVLSFFYKDVDNFIIEQAEIREVQGFGDEDIIVISPINFSEGTVEGFEVGFIQDLNFLPGFLSKLGAQANYTYVDSGFDQDVGDAGFGFPGSSKNNFNLGLFYEDGPVTLRTAYTYRDDYFRALAGTGAQTDTARFSEGFGQLNASATWRVNRNVRFTLSGANLTDEYRRDFIGSKSNFLAYFERGRTVSASLRLGF